ncbi:MAG TPA: universal stress protein [Polyangiaceae bacterium]|nr:universal stress protein [Polyangiaceae bacterium]
MKKSSAPDHWLADEIPSAPAIGHRVVTRVPRPARNMRPPRPVRKNGPRLVLALHGADRPTPSLRRALAIARSLEGELHLLRVLPGLTRLQALFSPNDVLNAARSVQRTLRANRVTRSWLRVSVGSDDAVERLSISHGDFVQQVAVYAASVDAHMIIIAPLQRRLGRTATILARAAQKPVFVAREQAGTPAILAATDLRTIGHPVLWKAAELGQRLHSKLVTLHNVDAVGVSAPAPAVLEAGAMAFGAAAWSAVQGSSLRDARLEQLTAATARLPLEARAMVLSEADTARAILAQASTLDSDCVVVGSRRQSWLEGLACGSVAADVVDGAQRSVLIVPLDATVAAPMSAVDAGG